jgi:phage protein D
MDLDTFKPTFLIQIEGQDLSKDITQEITSFVFTDNEEELDVLELSVTDRNLQFVDDPLFQEGNEIVARFGYVGNLSPRKKAVIKDIDYDFPENGDPTIRIKAYDKGFKLAGKENQKVWQKPAPGILYSEIAEQDRRRQRPHSGGHGHQGDRHLRVTQSNISDAQFLKELAEKARDRDGDGVSGYVFYIQDDELHFHPRDLDQTPLLTLEYFTDTKGLLRSFRPSTQSQGAKGAGVETKTVGVDPRKKDVVEHKANNATTPERTALGKQTYLVDGNTGEGSFKEQETGQIVPSFDRSEGFHEEPRQEPAQDRSRANSARPSCVRSRRTRPPSVFPSYAPRRTSRSRAWDGSFPASTTATRCATAFSGAAISANSNSRRTPSARGGRQVRRVPGQTQRQGGPANAAKRAASHGDHRRGLRRGHTRRRQWVISARISTVRNSPAKARTAAAIRLRSIPTWSTPCRRCATASANRCPSPAASVATGTTRRWVARNRVFTRWAWQPT